MDATNILPRIKYFDITENSLQIRRFDLDILAITFFPLILLHLTYTLVKIFPSKNPQEDGSDRSVFHS